MKCAECKSDKMGPTTHDAKRVVGPYIYVMQVAALKCAVCGQVVLDTPELEIQELCIALDLAVRGARDGQSFRFMRKMIDLTASDVAKLLHVTPETISRWETDKPGHEVEPSAVAVLGALVTEYAVAHYTQSPLVAKQLMLASSSMYERLGKIAGDAAPPKRPIRSVVEALAKEMLAWKKDSAGGRKYGESVADMVDKLRRENEALQAKVAKLEKRSA